MAYTFYENDNRVIRYAEALGERGHDVDVIALRRPRQRRRERMGGVAVYRIQRRAIGERRARAYLAKVLLFLARATLVLSVLHIRKRYDLIHVHNVPDFLVFSGALPKMTGAKIILDIHDVMPELYAGKFHAGPRSKAIASLLGLERLSCRFADHVIVANHLWRDTLTRRAVSSDKCTPIMNYPDLRLFKVRAPQEGRRDESPRYVMLYPGTLNNHQGVDVAIKAFARVRHVMPDAEFQIYGEGPERPRLLELVDELQLNGRVMIKDRVPIREIAALMAAADVGIVPKRADGFGNEAFSTKVLEFMACGVPVIVSRTKVDRYYFDETMVRFCAPGDEADLARAMFDVYSHRAEHEAWISRAQRYVREHSWQQRVGDYLDLVASMFTHDGGAPPRAGTVRPVA